MKKSNILFLASLLAFAITGHLSATSNESGRIIKKPPFNDDGPGERLKKPAPYNGDGPSGPGPIGDSGGGN